MAKDADRKNSRQSVRASSRVTAKLVEYREREIEPPPNGELEMLIDVGDSLKHIRAFRKLTTRAVEHDSGVKGGPLKISLIERALFPGLTLVEARKIADALGYQMEVTFKEKK